MADKHYPEPIAGAFILNKEMKLFLMKSPKWSNLFVVPGGHIEIGERIEAALKREIREETGLIITQPTFLCILEFISGAEYYKKKHMIFLNYVVRTKSEKVKLNEEATEYLWVTRDEALKLPLEEYTKMTIEMYLKSFS